jgi:hypothetical protein
MTEGFKQLSLQIIAYKEAVEILREMNPDEAQIIDASVAETVNSPAVQAMLNQKFDAALERFVQQDPVSLSDPRVLAFLESMIQERKLNIFSW